MNLFARKGQELLAFLKSLPEIFYSIPFYQRLIKRGTGIGLGFLFVVTLLLLAQTAQIMTGPSSTLWDKKAEIFSALPDVTISNGKLSIAGSLPFEMTVLTEAEGGPLKIVIDPSLTTEDEAVLSKKMDDENIAILAAQKKILLMSGAPRKEVIPVSELKDKKLTHELWLSYAQFLGDVFLPTFFFFSFLFIFMKQTMAAAVGALGLWGLGFILKVSASFSAAMRLSAAAQVPAALLSLFLPMQGLFLLLVWLGFALFGLLAARREQAAS